MITIHKLVSEGKCSYCGKGKEVCEVEMDGRKTLLCWVDIKRHVNMRSLPQEKEQV